MTTKTLPTLAEGHILMTAPTLDEDGEYLGGDRMEVSDVDEAHVATSIVDNSRNGRYRHAPVLDIDVPSTFEESMDMSRIGIRGWLAFSTRPSREKDTVIASHLLEALDLGTLSWSNWTRSVYWYLPEDTLHELVPSSTEGHHHLYLSADLPEHPYLRLLVALARVGILEPGFVRASLHRGHSAVRLPWVKKGDLVLHSEHRPEPVPPLSLPDFNTWLLNERADMDPDPNGDHL